MTEAARALWYVAPRVAEVRATTLSAEAEYVEAIATHSALSRGTEALVSSGRVPASQYELMRAPWMEGDFPFPVKYGYAWVGRRIEDARRVFALHPHQDRVRLPPGAFVEIPDPVPCARATLAANMETALNAVWDAQPELERTTSVTVIGAGVVGSLVAYALTRLPRSDLDLEVLDPEPRRAPFLERLGLTLRAPEQARADRQLIFHASGTAPGLRQALDLAAFEGRIIELSWFGDQEVALPLGGSFHSRRLQLRASQVGHVAPSRRDRCSRRDRLALAVEMLDHPALDLLIGERCPFEQLPARLPELLARGGLHHIIRYDGASGSPQDGA